MMDYYSYISAPSKEEAIREVVQITNEDRIARTIIHRIDCLGSYTGWYVHVKPRVVAEVKKRVLQRKCEKYWVEYVMRNLTGDTTFTY